jgi:hypothetical protein
MRPLVIALLLTVIATSAVAIERPVYPPDPDFVIPPTAQRSWFPLREADPTIQSLVDQVAWTGLEAKIGWLQDFGTRHSYTPQIQVVADSLYNRFAAMGLAVEFHEFSFSGRQMRNVIATQMGTTYPDSIIVICGHYDCTSETPQTFAPGADDNASGTAVVLTAAELLSPVPCAYTIKYICFAGEEQGLRGSLAWVADAYSRGLNIQAALNFDMVAWWTTGVDFDTEIEVNQASAWLGSAIVDAVNTYTDMRYELHIYDGAWWGDHASFWQYGYAAANHEESWDWGDPDFNPRYHSTEDLLEYCDPGFTVGNAQIAVAALATLAQPVTGVTGAPLPEAVALSLTAHPNPFNGSVTIAVAADPQLAGQALEIFDIRGFKVAELLVPLEQGQGSVTWRGVDHSGRAVPSGTYLCRAVGASASEALKLIYVR